MALKSIGWAVILAGALSGCGAVDKMPGASTVKGWITGEKEAPPPRAADMPRAQIAASGQAVRRVEVERTLQDTLIAVGERKGDVALWVGSNGTSYALRNDVLIESRGLGPDLMSAHAPSAAQIRAGGSYRRSYFVMSENDQTLGHDFNCTSRAKGEESVTIYGLSYPSLHMVEECTGASGQIRNDYWFQGAKIRKSREWFNPDYGHLIIERITE